jgi:hypothetical protein
MRLKTDVCIDPAQKGTFAIKAMLKGAGLFTRLVYFAARRCSFRSMQPSRMDTAHLQNGHHNDENKNGRQTVFHHFRKGALRFTGRNTRPHGSPVWLQRLRRRFACFGAN